MPIYRDEIAEYCYCPSCGAPFLYMKNGKILGAHYTYKITCDERRGLSLKIAGTSEKIEDIIEAYPVKIV